MAKIIWTQDMRKILFARMKMEFGAFATWGGVSYPIDNKVRFDQVAKELASFFSEMVGSSITSGAVKNQLQWGITKQEEINSPSFARNFILNAAAALEVGFITSADLPAFMKIN